MLWLQLGPNFFDGNSSDDDGHMATKSDEDEDVSVVASLPEELQTIVERANATAVKAAAETAESIFDQVDKDADGKLTEKEFAIWAEHNQEKAGIFFSFLDENDFQGGGGVSFKDKVGVFWLKAVMEFDDNVDMKLDKAEFCTLYNKLARAKEADVEPIQRS